jgi:hypothetical protein
MRAILAAGLLLAAGAKVQGDVTLTVNRLPDG